MQENRGIIFDCDGVLIDSEELHRISYNKSFQLHHTGVVWDEPLYEMLQNTVGGGKEKITWYFTKVGWPSGISTEEEKRLLVNSIHQDKTQYYIELLRKSTIPLRPGIARFIDEAYARGYRLCVCSAANQRAVNLVMERVLKERAGKFCLVLAGDVVSRKKPDPEIYLLAKDKLGLSRESCVVIEDSQIGLQAAKAAGLRCIITPTKYTESQNFQDAIAVYSELGDNVQIDQFFLQP
ncbi:haloacid dehalogenaselike hydrolase [Galdieria sulphuraria]|uniref:Haloacid dehalogenaselike hydrolase n=1 Tax=Galdieria sulphuraria TaxID=130081 RepID=M2Y7L6_GALSU|nr:haloacid dehalogenaselike hydrolase [Galdieria sulphuraria]EME32058.1 haloacid dehalogenaselike hydrolase [Galdieria sulphuraria]|eukprot:XP_005708578.1 haloacid dehalogenaselike hydrolase [Galdieria sulphuraria]